METQTAKTDEICDEKNESWCDQSSYSLASNMKQLILQKRDNSLLEMKIDFLFLSLFILWFYRETCDRMGTKQNKRMSSFMILLPVLNSFIEPYWFR